MVKPRSPSRRGSLATWCWLGHAPSVYALVAWLRSSRPKVYAGWPVISENASAKDFRKANLVFFGTRRSDFRERFLGWFSETVESDIKGKREVPMT